MSAERKPALLAASPSPAPSFADDESRWQALVQRDLAADGVFVYAVQTTGVYCRPTCGSRLAKREHVRFYATTPEAEAAGFRPCKRCRPHQLSLAESRQQAVARACALIGEAEVAPDLKSLAASAGLSPYHFHRVFKEITGVTPKAYAAAQRAQRVREGLARGASVTAAMYGAGFNSSGRFYATSTQQLGITPRVFRAGGPGVASRFAVGQCSLGSVLVAASGQGICALLLGDDPEALVRDLQDRFPRAELAGDDAAFDQWVAAAIGLVERPALGHQLPLDVRGTAFQQRVWEVLRRIPPGTTATYTQIAEKLGQPRAARAVARACAANPLAVAIPCHRVVRRDESLSGYRWGVERKAELLRREGARA
ncbi:MAG: bifunctional DNA-binding transcriptional regulator/O6-methylguanine-DNA methyltransferase Ada [Candidatus Latescibacteria bacterium]|nr:bifunctional DNA-binding transcriptional regulator/O6-methylguanine-DNA methyltransferase Ada [Candidatus Latescibacterota bacterium]